MLKFGKVEHFCVTSCFHREVDDACAILRFYTEYIGNYLWMFRDNLSVLCTELGILRVV